MNEHGDLPSGWTLAPLRDVATINPPNPAKVPADGTPVSFVPMAAVEQLSGRMNASVTRLWSDVKKGFTRFQDGDVVFAKITPCMENGKVALAANLFNGVAAGTTEFHVFRPQSGVTGRYLLQYLLQETFRRQARARMTGTAGQLRVPTRFLEEEVLPLAPTPEQQRIVEAVDSYLTRLDAAVTSLERVQTKLKTYRASVLKTAVEGRLVPTEAALARTEKRDYESAEVLLARILKERRRRWEEAELAKLKAAGKTPKDDKWKAKYDEPVAPDTGTLPELPEGWCWASASALCTAIGDVDHKMPVATKNGIPYVSTRDFWGFNEIDFVGAKRISDEMFNQLCRKIQPQFGDILLSRYGTVGEVRLIERRQQFQASYSIAILKLVDTFVSAYVAYVLRSAGLQAQMRNWIRASAQPDLGLAHIRQLAIPLPPSAEQERIRSEVDRLLSISSHLDTAIAAEALRIPRLRQAVLKWAFEGKLVDQNHNDEPAPQLLARILADRVAAAPATKKRGRSAKGVI